ncbi:13868_t:CDS:1, partial [Gigaspora margarita]
FFVLVINMPPKRKTPPTPSTPPHIANDNRYKPPTPTTLETEIQKARRLDRR